MIKARHVGLAVWFFNWYLTAIIRRDFRQVVFDMPMLEAGKSILVLANHFSWWDGFFQVYSNRFHFRKRYHVMMLEEQLRPRWLLRYAGAYSIRIGHRSTLETLAYTNEVLQNPSNMVLVFPQGRIESQYVPHVGFQNGVLRLLKSLPENAHILFCVASIDYGSARKPTLYLNYKLFTGHASEVEAGYAAYYEAIREAQAQKQSN